jgi:hypothetical protein
MAIGSVGLKINEKRRYKAITVPSVACVLACISMALGKTYHLRSRTFGLVATSVWSILPWPVQSTSAYVRIPF